MFSNATTYVKGRHTFKAGISVEYSGEDDFDQINVNSIPGGTNNQNGAVRFPQQHARTRSGLGISDMALGLFTNYAEIGERAFTKWRALATDVFFQDSWKPTSSLTIEGGIRWALWPPWYSTTNNIANFDPRFYDAANAAVINPSTGRIVSGPRYNGIVLPGDGFEGDGNDLVVAQDPQGSGALPRRAARVLRYPLQRVRAAAGRVVRDQRQDDRADSAGVFHNRSTLNDSSLLGGNPPFQPMVTVANGSVDNPSGGRPVASDLPFGMQGQEIEFNPPTAYTWSAGVQRELPYGFVVDATYVGRRGNYNQRERNINQLLQPGTLQANPGVNIAALRPYKGYGALRIAENSGPFDVQQPAAER